MELKLPRSKVEKVNQAAIIKPKKVKVKEPEGHDFKALAMTKRMRKADREEKRLLAET